MVGLNYGILLENSYQNIYPRPRSIIICIVKVRYFERFRMGGFIVNFQAAVSYFQPFRFVVFLWFEGGGCSSNSIIGNRTF